MPGLCEDSEREYTMKANEFLTYIDQSIAACAKKERALIEENRKDEANMERIKSNVYGIAKSLYQVTEELADKHGEEHRAMFVDKMEAVMVPWKKSLEAAKQHMDSEKECVELIKLSVAEEIVKVFQS